MYSFENDYSEGAHPQILKAMIDHNLVQQKGYGLDDFTKQACSIMQERLGTNNIDIHFVVGGTQANKVSLASFLRPYEAVICTDEGHINTHEAGAIEANGHKVIAVDSPDGKLTTEMIQSVLDAHDGDEHMVQPRLVYISNSTELGTIYKIEELKVLSQYCRDHNLLFYMDGARFGSALTSNDNNVNMSDLPNLFDAFYIGATKNGALYGEAIVIVNESLKPHFRTMMKQNGALLAKSSFLAIQFIELFKSDLYLKLASTANNFAMVIKKTFVENNYQLYVDSSTNQQFIILTNEQLRLFQQKYVLTIWKKYDENHTVVRFVTSWATSSDKVKELLNDIVMYK